MTLTEYKQANKKNYTGYSDRDKEEVLKKVIVATVMKDVEEKMKSNE